MAFSTANERREALPPATLRRIGEFSQDYSRIYRDLENLCKAEPMVFRALVTYYGAKDRCDWNRYTRLSLNTFDSMWNHLEGQTLQNPYHLVVALHAAQYLVEGPYVELTKALARAISTVIPRDVDPPKCVGPDGIRVLADGTIHDPESLSESRDVRLLEDIEDNHWRLYGALRRACNANKETLDRVKQYYGRPERMGWHAENQASLKTFDSVWGILTSAVMETRNPRYLVKALTMESSAAPKSEPSEVVGGLINDIIATDVVMPDDL
jgi:hypothetical protein